jgi:predicted O-linked N-acetylglucosamine transferase (SPINDLY family)
MDYWITDRHIAADDCPEDYRTEALLALPDLERCFRPDEDCPQVSPAPVARKGAITFASFHAAYKLNDEVLELWGTLLNLVPQAELLIVSVPKGKAQARVLRILSAHGVAPERVRMYPRVSLQEFFALHSQADVNLDAFPFCGVTTTLQGLWMGVPTLTLQGARYSARVGASIMANLGLRAFIAHSAAEYVKKACELASDPLELVRLRSTMRPRMLASPILDERRFTRELEAVYLRCLGNSPLERSGLLGDGGWLKLY